jgi:uncharacterized membrane protein YadS
MWQLRCFKHESTIPKKEFFLKFLPIPWFIIGFIMTSGFNTMNVVNERVSSWMVNGAYLLMAMAGLGLNVELKTFKKLGQQAFITVIIGSILLAILGYFTTVLFLG